MVKPSLKLVIIVEFPQCTLKIFPKRGNLLRSLTLKVFCVIVFCSDCTLCDGRDIDFPTSYFLLLLLLLARMLWKVCQTASINYSILL